LLCKLLTHIHNIHFISKVIVCQFVTLGIVLKLNYYTILEVVFTHLWSWVYGELKLRLLPIVHAQPLHEEGCEPRASATSEGVENEETLKTSATISLSPGTTYYIIYHITSICFYIISYYILLYYIISYHIISYHII